MSSGSCPDRLSCLLPVEPEQLGIDRDDDRAGRHEYRADGRSHQEPRPERDARRHRYRDGVVARRPDHPHQRHVRYGLREPVVLSPKRWSFF